MTRSQDKRELAISTPLGPDVLLLARFEGREELGRLFKYRLELLSDSADIKFEDLIGQNVTLRIATPSGATRHINGHVRRFVQTGFEPGAATYEAVVVPWLWFLTRTSDCRIFQNKSVPDIVKEVIKGHGFSDIKESCSGTYPSREYCVQYRETDFDFVSRLLEHEGIYYYFEHENGKHTMVLADAPAAHGAAPGAEEIKFHLHNEGELSGEFVYEWSVEKATLPGRVALNDFDFTKPAAALESKSSGPREHAAANFELYDNSGGFTTTSEGERYAKTRLEEWQSAYEQVEGETDVRVLCVGHTFKLAEHPRADQNREYLITSAEYCGTVADYSTGESGKSDNSEKAAADDDDEEPYECSFTAIPASQPFRPDRTTPRPYIRGPQTAIVAGKSSEEIWTDEHGRVKVQFHWDRNCPGDENSSCWVRVAQSVAGKKWGAVFLPRKGQEVIVEFLEGDPDRPIITGRVYNGQNKLPYDLPGDATKSGLKSSSSKGGDGFNEIRMQDKAGEEELYFHAQKDMNTYVEHDVGVIIVNDSSETVKHDSKTQIDNDRHDKVGHDHVEEIGNDRSLTVVGVEKKQVTGKLSLTVSDDVAERFEKNHHEEVTESLYLKAKNIVIEATENLTIKVKQTTIAMEQDGFALATQGKITTESTQGTEMKATGAFKIEGTASTEVKGTGGLKLNSPAITEVKGSLVNIN